MCSEDRIYGVDVARVFAMFLVVALHVSSVFSGAAGVNWGGKIVHVSAYCCVDLFALISGFVGVRGRWAVSRIVTLWLQVFVTGLIVFSSVLLVIMLWGDWHPSLKDWGKVFLPISSHAYWYATAYFLLYLLMPVLNAGLNKLSIRQLEVSLLVIFLLVVLIPSFNPYVSDTYALGNGYSPIWLVVCYLFGGWMRLRGVTFLRARYWFVLATIFTIIGFFRSNSYVQPHVFLTAVCYLAGFAQLGIRGGGGGIESVICKFFWRLPMALSAIVVWATLPSIFILV